MSKRRRLIAIAGFGAAALAMAILVRYAALTWVPDEAIDELPPMLPCHRHLPETLASNRPACRIAAQRYWLEQSDADVLRELIVLADDPNPVMRGMVAEILGEIETKDPSAFEALSRLATDTDVTVSSRAVWSLGSFPCELLDQAFQSLDDPSREPLISAARGRCSAPEWRTCNGLAMRAVAEQREVRPGERVNLHLTLFNARAHSMVVPRPDHIRNLTVRLFDGDGVEVPRTRRLPPSMVPHDLMRLNASEQWAMDRPFLYEPGAQPTGKRMRLDFGLDSVELDPGEYTLHVTLAAGMELHEAPPGSSADAVDDLGWFGEITVQVPISLAAGD